MTDDVAVSLAGIRKTFGTTVAVDRLTFSVRVGEMFGVIGPDGAGKTTALRLMCGLLRPDAGTVRVFENDPVRAHRAASKSIGYVSQHFSLYGDLSIDENIAFFASIHGVRDFADRRTRLVELTGLAPFRDRRADRLSGGMKQKLALACTLVHEPNILILDEPTTGVDPVSRREFWKLLAEFLSQKLTIIMATPYLDEAERCSRVALLNHGTLMALDEPARLQAASRGTILEVVVQQPRRVLQRLRDRLGDQRVQLFGDRLHVRLEEADAAAHLTALLQEAGLEVTSVRPIVATLEDVFIELLARTT
jgi:drug efflux transport system ATP-binding protein